MGIKYTRSGSATGFITPSGQEVLTNKDIDGGTASNESRITIPKDTHANLLLLTRKEGTVVYATDLDKLFSDDGTNLVELGSGAGGLANYMTNPNFETSISEGVTPSTIDTAAEIANPLFGDQSLRVTSQANVGYVDFALNTIDEAVEDGGILLGVSGYFKVGNGASEADGDYKVGIHDGTSYVTGTEIDLKAGEINIHRTTFVAVSGTTYTYRLEFTDTTISKICDVDELGITYQSSTAIQAFEQKTNWVNNAVLGVTGDNGFTVSEAQGYAFVDANGDYGFTFTIYGSKTNNSTGCQVTITGITGGPGTFQAISGYEAVNPRYAPASNNFYTGDIQASANSSTVIIGGTIKTGTNKPSWFDANLDNSKVNLITPNLLKSNVRARWTPSALTAVTAGSTYPMDTEVYSDGFTNASGVITIPVDGEYAITFNMLFDTNQPNTGSTVLKHGSDIVAYSNSSNGTSEGRTNTIAYQGRFLAGDTFEIEQDNVTSPVIANSSVNNLTVSRVANYSSTAPVGFGTASETQYGLMLKNKIERRVLSTNVQADNADITELKFTTLTVGQIYTVRLSAFFVATATTAGDRVCKLTAGTQVFDLVFRADGATSYRNVQFADLTFTADAATVIISTSGGWSSTNRLDIQNQNTYCEVEERHDLVFTTDLS